MKYTYPYILARKYSHRKYSTDGHEFSGIIYHDNLPEISQKEFEKADLEIQALEYLELRKNEYPSIEQQLQLIWQAMDTGELPKASTFYNVIKAVNDKYPDPK